MWLGMCLHMEVHGRPAVRSLPLLGPADLRETLYDQDGTGTMYLFRLDATQVVDATRVVRSGSMGGGGGWEGRRAGGKARQGVGVSRDMLF